MGTRRRVIFVQGSWAIAFAAVAAALLGACSGPTAMTPNTGTGGATTGTGGAGGAGSGGSGGSGGMPSGSGGGSGGMPITDGGGGGGAPATDAGSADDAPPAGDGGATVSAGCGKAVTDPAGQYVFNKTIMVDGVARKYHLRLPAGYNVNKPYRTIFSFHGCGSHNDNLINIQNATGFDAIIIAPEQISGNCYDDQSSMSKDMAVFDALVVWAEDNLCVDKGRIFSMGFSSGSWMTNILGCQRANVLRGKANVSGGFTGALNPARDCKGAVAGIFLHDASDTQNSIAGGMHARDILLMENGCSMTSKPYTDVPANAMGLCMTYDGCKAGYPVVWCQTTGINHDPQQTRSPNLFWGFLSKL